MAWVLRQIRRLRRRFNAAQALLVLGAALLAGPSAASQGNWDDSTAIVNGLDSQQHAAVGALLYGGGGPIDRDNASSWCSGTLIGCSTFLTAAHCVDADRFAGTYSVYFQHGGLYQVTSIALHPQYTAARFPDYDIAVLQLSEQVAGVAPLAFATTAAPSFGTTATIVGFGRTSASRDDYGVKRYGRVQTADCSGAVGALGNEQLVCWRFTAPVGAAGDDSNTCNGDSGGPLLLDADGVTAVAGVTSGGSNASCLSDDLSYDANVFAYRDFISARRASDDLAGCGGVAAVGEAGVTVVERSGRLNDAQPAQVHSLTVGSPLAVMRVTLNIEEVSGMDANLFVKAGPGVSRSDFDCADAGASNFADCLFVAPAGGSWSILVERNPATSAASADYQLTITTFDGPAPACGNDIREFAEQCDGVDASSCPQTCDADCRCPLVCNSMPLSRLRSNIDGNNVKFKANLDNSSGRFDGLDPRDGFRLTLSQDDVSVGLELAAGDPGWSRSKPRRGRYRWRGQAGGFNRATLLDRSEGALQAWKVLVKGRQVSDAEAINPAVSLDVRVDIDAACNVSRSD